MIRLLLRLLKRFHSAFEETVFCELLCEKLHRMTKKYLGFVVLQICLKLAQAWFEACDYKDNVTTSVFYVINSNYPNRYQPGSSCKWYLSAPTGYTINLECTYNLDTPMSDCQSQRLYVSRDGDKNLTYAEYFCGYSTLERNSVGNEMTVGYASNIGGSGWIYCEARAVLTTQDNCQCGWSKSVRKVDQLELL